jgi:hypothetical protein
VPAAILVRSVRPATDDAPRRSRVATYGLTYQDWRRIAALPAVRETVPVRGFPQEASRRARFFTARVVGTTPGYAELMRLDVAEGRFLAELDGARLRNVAVLGATVAEALFPGEDPLGATVVVSKNLYIVVGVLGEQDVAAGGPAALEANRSIYVPLQTVQARFGERIIIRRPGGRSAEAVPLTEILVAVRQPQSVAGTADNIRDVLGYAHEQKDWAVQLPPAP